MRIAFVTTSYPRHPDDPSGHFVREEVLALERGGHEVVVFEPGDNRAFGWPGVVARLRDRPWLVGHAAAWVGAARGALGRQRFERVVAHWSVPCAWPIAHGVDAELHVVSHGGDIRAISGLFPPLRDRLALTIARDATEWRFVSEALLDRLLAVVSKRTAAAVRSKARVAACPIAIPRGAPGRPPGLAGRRLLVCVGRLVASKRVEAAIDYAARSGHEPPVLVVVGDGPERAALELHARARGLDARFLGKTGRTEALSWISAADELLHASRDEGLSTVVREAEALGTKVVLV